MNFRSVILLVCSFLFGVVITSKGNTRVYAAHPQQILAFQEDEQDAQDCFEESLLVFSEIHAQRPSRLRSRFTVSSSYFIISASQRAEEVSIRDIRSADTVCMPKQTQTLPFYYLFLFRLTPF
ncbi:MAG: hypothetical protein ACTHMC_23490 [Pseudobacter sp.]|uniref:hypothetical protein n=1 Tax=Pseudobacter sp. TaxID=2045420 RepID=UPI003F7EB31F